MEHRYDYIVAVNLVQNLLDAIVTQFATIASSFPGGIWHGEAPENTTMPYVVYQDLGGASANIYGALQQQEPDVQFSVVAVLDSTAGNLLTQVLQAYLGTGGDGALLSLASGSITNIWAAHAPVNTRIGRDESTTDTATQDDVWMATTTIHYVLSP